MPAIDLDPDIDANSRTEARKPASQKRIGMVRSSPGTTKCDGGSFTIPPALPYPLHPVVHNMPDLVQDERVVIIATVC